MIQNHHTKICAKTLGNHRGFFFLRKSLFLTLISLLFFSCVSSNFPDTDTVNNQPIKVSVLTFNDSKCVVAWVNLNSSDIVIQCYPEQAEKDFWFEAKRTGTFARESQCFMAVNASPFEKKNFISTKRRTVGIHRSQKTNLSSPEEKYSAITFSKKDAGYSASIIKNQNEIEIEKSDYAFGGFFTIVQNGKYVDEYKKIRDARLAIGIKDNSRTLIFLAAEKLTFEECAKLLINLGCTDAIEMDGGSSTEISILGKTYRPCIITRKQGSSFGFRKLAE